MALGERLNGGITAHLSLNKRLRSAGGCNAPPWPRGGAVAPLTFGTTAHPRVVYSCECVRNSSTQPRVCLWEDGELLTSSKAD